MGFLKGAMIFLLGAGAGAAGSYLYFKKKYDADKEELNELKDHYYCKINVKDDLDIAETIIKKANYMPEIETRLMNDEPIVVASPPEDYPEEPIIITEEDYSEKELSFDKYEVDFYVGDNALVDENNELIESCDAIGYENLEKFISDESEDVMYIRNASSGADYMVRKVFGEYSGLIGVGGDEYDD